ncbi:MAG: replication initiation protein, partial [Minisyncoccia bacterium]
MDKNYLVTQSNKLISAHYDLSLEEQRIILTLASMIQPEDEEFKSYEFKIKEFIKLIGVSTKTKYTDIPKITENLMKKIIKIREDKKLIQVSWLSSAVYNERTGTVILRFDPNLKPYLLKLNELFTSFKLANVLNLKSKYAIRIYEILKSYEYRKSKYIIIEISELRLMLGINDTEYNRYDNFKRKVILQAQKEINKKTDLSFDFEEIKTGKKVTSLKFIISKNPLVLSNKKDECNDVLEEICITSENMLEDNNVINDDNLDKVMFL